MEDPLDTVISSFEEALANLNRETYVLRLYVAGSTRFSLRAMANIRKICDQYLQGRHDLQVIDIYQQPALTPRCQILAAPTLIKEHPLPVRKFIGDLSQTEKLLRGLDLLYAAPGARRTA